MCVGIPMRIVESHGLSAVAEGRGLRREVSLMLTGDVAEGALVLVHKDSAVHILTPEDAAAIDAALDEAEAALRALPLANVPVLCQPACRIGSESAGSAPLPVTALKSVTLVSPTDHDP